MPMIIIELGTSTRTFSSTSGERNGTLSHDGEQFSYRVVGPREGERSSDVAVVSSLRIGIGLRHGIYVAGDLELGGLVSPVASRAEMTTPGARGTPTISQNSAILMSGLAVVGAARAAGRGSFGVEVAGGVRTLSYKYESHYGACEQTDRITTSAPVLEARARASVWLTPMIIAGATLGASLIDHGSWMAGLHLGVQTHAFGGQR